MEIQSRLSEALEQCLPAVAAGQRALLERYLSLVSEYRTVLNLTAFRGPVELADELAAESARLLAFGELAPGLRCVDLGSGVGSPVIALAVLSPQASFVAVEARDRRAAFLRQVAAELKLGNLRVLHQRSDELARAEPQAFGLVTARAFGKPALLMREALSLLAPEGELRSFFGPEIGLVQAAAAAAGMELHAVEAYQHNESLRHIYCCRRAI